MNLTSKVILAGVAGVAISGTMMSTQADACGIGVSEFKLNVNLNLRQEPNTNSTIKTTIKAGSVVKPMDVSQNGQWGKVIVNGVTGWISMNPNYVTELSCEEEQEDTVIDTNTVYKTTANLNVRADRSASSRIKTTLSKNTKVEVMSITSGWARVRFETARGTDTGYCSVNYLVKANATTNEVSNNVVNLAGKEAKTTARINFRTEASSASKNTIIRVLEAGEQVSVIEQEGDWCLVEVSRPGTGKYQVGYASAKYLQAL